LGDIDQAVRETHGDADARRQLERRLVGILGTDAPDAAQSFVCRKLSIIGTESSVAALAALLDNRQLAHMSRYALERIPGPAAAVALREALPRVEGSLKIGVISSLGARRDEASLDAIVALLHDAETPVAASCAAALGAIGSSAASKALGDFLPEAPPELQLAVADAYLSCAEQLLADGKKTEAMSIYNKLRKGEHAKHVKLAAQRGMLAILEKR
jgi:HEAT repeat protein